MFQWLVFTIVIFIILVSTILMNSSSFFCLFLHSELVLLSLLSIYSVMIISYADIAFLGLSLCFLIIGSLEIGLNLLLFTIG